MIDNIKASTVHIELQTIVKYTLKPFKFKYLNLYCLNKISLAPNLIKYFTATIKRYSHLSYLTRENLDNRWALKYRRNLKIGLEVIYVIYVISIQSNLDKLDIISITFYSM